MKNEIQSKFKNLNTRLNQIESNWKSNITEQVNESIMSVKDSIITALKDENKMLQVKAEIPEKKKTKKKTGNVMSFTRLDQYNSRNNLEIQGIPSTVDNEFLEDKVIEISESLNILIAKSDIVRLPDIEQRKPLK